MPKYYQKVLEKLFVEQDIETYFIIQILAESCYRYLALIDNLIREWVEEVLPFK